MPESLTDQINQQLSRVYSPIKIDIENLQRRLIQDVAPRDQVIREPFAHLGATRGKLIRPAIFFLAARAFGKVTENHRIGAHCVELVHVASLIHDDVVDHSPMRRGRASLNARFGDEKALLVGDYLFSRALSLLSPLNSLDAYQCVSQSIVDASAGELRQLEFAFSPDVSEKDYFDYVSRKTAGLFKLACELSAIVSGLSDDTRNVLAQFGVNFGIAFQVADDCADLFNNVEDEGKPVMKDVREGQFTLPVLRLFQLRGRDWVRKWLAELSASGETAIARLSEELRCQGVSDYCIEQGEFFVDRARRAVLSLDSDSVEELVSVCDVLSKKLGCLAEKV
ncbi:MAG: polyprenyl synthetase family protein [Planctomycetota bacterium]|nr:polyprenyl synthetase family protein [Planctomycetota bacterium]